MKMLAVAMLVSSLITGCASVKMEASEASDKAKQVGPPTSGNAGLYVYRDDSLIGGVLKKDIWIDGKCIGESAPGVFFSIEANPGQHTLSTESEFSPNNLSIAVEAGKNYFYRQFLNIGFLVGRADLESIPEEQAKVSISKLRLAKPGTCKGSYSK